MCKETFLFIPLDLQESALNSRDMTMIPETMQINEPSQVDFLEDDEEKK